MESYMKGYPNVYYLLVLFLRISIGFFLLFFALPGYGQVSLSRISVKGNKFVSAEGKEMIFRGYNSSDPDKLEKSGHWNKEYFQELKEWGANVVRFPIHPKAWRERGKENYLAILDQGVEWAGTMGMYVILDWHSIGNLKSQQFYKEIYETNLKETHEFWRTMAIHYQNNSVVAFFELFNEPTLYKGKLGNCSWEEWKIIMEELITVIRNHGCSTVPLITGFNWGYDLTNIRDRPIQAEGIGYVSHPYPQKRNKPWDEKWTMDWGYVAEKYPMILTEIGFCGEDDRGAHSPVISDESYGEAITQYCLERGISYVVWVFDPNWTPMLFEDWSFKPTRQGRFFKDVITSCSN